MNRGAAHHTYNRGPTASRPFAVRQLLAIVCYTQFCILSQLLLLGVYRFPVSRRRERSDAPDDTDATMDAAEALWVVVVAAIASNISALAEIPVPRPTDPNQRQVYSFARTRRTAPTATSPMWIRRWWAATCG